MSWEGWTLIALLVVIVIGWVLWLLANRVDRLHRTVLRSRASLETQLAQRSSAALELAMSGVLDPVESVLVADAAQRAAVMAPSRVVADGFEGPDDLEPVAVADQHHDVGSRSPQPTAPAPAAPAGANPASTIDRAMAESELSRTLRAVLESHDTADLADGGPWTEPLDRLEAAWFRLEVARRFHNAHVAEVRRLRGKPVVRILRLAGRAPMPASVEMDDVRPSPRS